MNTNLLIDLKLIFCIIIIIKKDKKLLLRRARNKKGKLMIVQ
jgi:hypothetical protein